MDKRWKQIGYGIDKREKLPIIFQTYSPCIKKGSVTFRESYLINMQIMCMHVAWQQSLNYSKSSSTLPNAIYLPFCVLHMHVYTHLYLYSALRVFSTLYEPFPLLGVPFASLDVSFALPTYRFLTLGTFFSVLFHY